MHYCVTFYLQKPSVPDSFSSPISLSELDDETFSLSVAPDKDTCARWCWCGEKSENLSGKGRKMSGELVHVAENFSLRNNERNNTTRRAIHFQSCFNLTSLQINFLFLPEKKFVWGKILKLKEQKAPPVQWRARFQLKSKSFLRRKGIFSAKYFPISSLLSVSINYEALASNLARAQELSASTKEYKLYRGNGKEQKKLHNARMDTQKVLTPKRRKKENSSSERGEDTSNFFHFIV